MLAGAAGLLASPFVLRQRTLAQDPLSFGLTPVFLTNDLELLTKLKAYLSRKCGREVELVQRRTYEEITALLVSAQLHAAWICGYPFVAYRDQLSLSAFRSGGAGRSISPMSSPPAVETSRRSTISRATCTLSPIPTATPAISSPLPGLPERNLRPDQFFRHSFFTYGHRNVVRAVAAGLAQSGSVDGYVWEVMAEIEPELTAKTSGRHPLGVAGLSPGRLPAQDRDDARSCWRSSRRSWEWTMTRRADEVLRLLRLDGFADEPPSLFDTIAAKMEQLRSLG